MALKRYRITGRGSFTRWEKDGLPIRKGEPKTDAHLIRHDADVNPEIIMDDAAASKHPEAGLILILDRDLITVTSDTGELRSGGPHEVPPRKVQGELQGDGTIIAHLRGTRGRKAKKALPAADGKTPKAEG